MNGDEAAAMLQTEVVESQIAAHVTVAAIRQARAEETALRPQAAG